MHVTAWGCLLMSLVTAPSDEVVARFESRSLVYTGGDYQAETFHYRLLAPPTVEPGKRYPLVIFLHGAGERGNDNLKQLQYLPEQMASSPWREEYPCYLLAPQCREGKRWVDVPWEAKESSPLANMSDQMRVVVTAWEGLQKDLPIDPRRVYLTGLSMGGFGSWDLAARFPDRFAAVVPICGGGDEAQAARLVPVPIWAWHGSADKAVLVERSRTMIEAIRTAGGKPKYTELEGVGHNSWTPAYSQPNGVIHWMFEQINERARP